MGGQTVYVEKVYVLFLSLIKDNRPQFHNTMDRVCAKQGVWSPNPLFCITRVQNHTEQADCLQSKRFGPCRLRGLPTVYRVLYQVQGWRDSLSSGGKHCPLWGVGESW